MGQGYFAKQDVIMRLHGTVCMYAGEPVVVYVNEGQPAEMVDIYDLKTYNKYKHQESRKRTVQYTDDAFVYKAFPLGYAYHPEYKSAIYVSRLPDRQQSQGLGQYVIRTNNGDYNINVHSPYMADCILGKHPCVAEAVQRVASGRANSCPFDRKFAVGQLRRGALTLSCRGKEVGLLVQGTESNPKFKLFSIKEAPLLKAALNGKAKVC